MASRAIQNSSRIPVVAKGQAAVPSHITEVYVKDIDRRNIARTTPERTSETKLKDQHGDVQLAQDHDNDVGQKGYETYLMTGEMIIRTSPPKSAKSSPEQSSLTSNSKIPKKSGIPRIPTKSPGTTDKKPQNNNSSPSPRLRSQIPGLVRNQNSTSSSSSSSSSSLPSQNMAAATSQVSDFGFVHAPVAELEEFSDLSQSSCSDGEPCLENSDLSSPNTPERLPVKNMSTTPPQPPPNHYIASRFDEAMETLDKMQSTLPDSTPGLTDTSFSEPPSSGDSGFIHDGQTSDTDNNADKNFVDNLGNALSKAQRDCVVSNETLTAKESSGSGSENVSSPSISLSSQGYANDNVVSSKSGEKFHMHDGNADHHLVRTSKSHENYLQGGAGLALVNIDMDDNLAYSLDTLTYHDNSNSSLDIVNTDTGPVSKSLNNSPEKLTDRDFIHPGYIALEDAKLKQDIAPPSTIPNRNVSVSDTNNSGQEDDTSSSDISPTHVDAEGVRQDLSSLNGYNPMHLGPLVDDSDAESLYHQPSKAVDKPSAERLAKRLFHLEGFKKSDVSRHLCKKNDFSNLVAEEYLKFFEFQEDTLDLALRKFLTHFSLNGETQERERVLQHFSRRFMECNPGSFNSEDACHTLTCAIMLLNSDLHAPNVGRRMTCQEFIENLAELNDGENFFKEVLRAIYSAIKSEPIEWAIDEAVPESDNHIQDSQLSTPPASPKVLDSNPFLVVPDPSKTTEYKKGYVMRKCCMETDRRRTPFGKRGWRMMYTVLRDMILYQYKDEHQLKRGSQFVESANNAIRIHHALATKANDYTKKQHVLRLQTADWAEYLFQTGDSQELQDWIDTINLVAASLSAPPLPGAVGSRAKFQRPLLPSSYTRLNLREQLFNHENREKELEQELQLHRAFAPEKGSKSNVIQEYLEKETYLEFEIKRFKTYVYLLQGKLTSCPDLEPSLVETTIGEYEEMGATTTSTPRPPPPPPPAIAVAAAVGPGPGPDVGLGNPVHRSLSDSRSGQAYRYEVYSRNDRSWRHDQQTALPPVVKPMLGSSDPYEDTTVSTPTATPTTTTNNITTTSTSQEEGAVSDIEIESVATTTTTNSTQYHHLPTAPEAHTNNTTTTATTKTTATTINNTNNTKTATTDKDTTITTIIIATDDHQGLTRTPATGSSDETSLYDSNNNSTIISTSNKTQNNPTATDTTTTTTNTHPAAPSTTDSQTQTALSDPPVISTNNNKAAVADQTTTTTIITIGIGPATTTTTTTTTPIINTTQQGPKDTSEPPVNIDSEWTRL